MRYQFDVVRWAEFCNESTNSQRKALPRGSSESVEVLSIQDKLSTTIDTPPVQKIYDSKNCYIRWLDKEYERVKHFMKQFLKILVNINLIQMMNH